MSDVKKCLPIYSFEKKKKLASKISNIKNKKHLKKIKEIIFKENPDISVKKTNRGVLMFFQNFTPSTYHKIENYLTKVSSYTIKIDTTSLSDNSSKLLLSSDGPSSTTDYSKIRTRLRYSNVEKTLIKRLQYEKLIKDNNNIVITNSENNNQQKVIIKNNNITPNINIFSKS